MVRLDRARRIVVGATVAVILVALPVALVTSNPERQALEKTQTRLDAMLVQRRAIAENLERFRAEVQLLMARVAEADLLLSPDLETLGQVMRERGAELVVGARESQGFVVLVSFRVRGTKKDSAVQAFSALDEAGHLFDLSSFEMTPTSWSLSGQAFEFIPSGDAAYVPSKAKRGPRWYASLNEDLRERIEEKRAELRRLDRKIGEVNAFTSLKLELKEKLAIIERLRAEMIDIRPFGLSLALTEAPPLSKVALTARAGVVRGIGNLAGDMHEAGLRSRLPDGFRFASYAPGPSRQVAFAIVPRK